MKDWIQMIDTTDDIIAAKGIMSHNFQAKKGFQKYRNSKTDNWVKMDIILTI